MANQELRVAFKIGDTEIMCCATHPRSVWEKGATIKDVILRKNGAKATAKTKGMAEKILQAYPKHYEWPDKAANKPEKAPAKEKPVAKVTKPKAEKKPSNAEVMKQAQNSITQPA